MHTILSKIITIGYCNSLRTVDDDMLLHKNAKSLELKVSMKMINDSRNMYKETLQNNGTV
jgi:hypothetical protein